MTEEYADKVRRLVRTPSHLLSDEELDEKAKILVAHRVCEDTFIVPESNRKRPIAGRLSLDRTKGSLVYLWVPMHSELPPFEVPESVLEGRESTLLKYPKPYKMAWVATDKYGIPVGPVLEIEE